jgi:hypothetical protein
MVPVSAAMSVKILLGRIAANAHPVSQNKGPGNVCVCFSSYVHYKAHHTTSCKGIDFHCITVALFSRMNSRPILQAMLVHTRFKAKVPMSVHGSVI